jgi:hypothetical protein
MSRSGARLAYTSERMFGRRASRPDATYLRSQRAAGLPVRPSLIARGLAERILQSGDDPKERRRLAQMLVDELGAGAGLTPCEVAIADKPQVHQHDGQRLQSKTYGYYRCWFADGRVSRARIRIYHRTARLQKVITPKVFLNTLLHEWVHHFDFDGLRLARSPHTSGFYARLRALAEALDVAFVLPPDPEEAARAAAAGPRPTTAPEHSATAARQGS